MWPFKSRAVRLAQKVCDDIYWHFYLQEHITLAQVLEFYGCSVETFLRYSVNFNEERYCYIKREPENKFKLMVWEGVSNADFRFYVAYCLGAVLLNEEYGRKVCFSNYDLYEKNIERIGKVTNIVKKKEVAKLQTQARDFALHYLMPSSSLNLQLYCNHSIHYIADKYGVSVDVARYRVEHRRSGFI